MIVNKSQLSEVLGISGPTIDVRLKHGMPFVKRGTKTKSWEFNTADVIKWEKDFAIKKELAKTGQVSNEELKKRKLNAETQLQELDLLKSVGEIIEIDEVAELIEADYIGLRSRLLNVPSRVAPLLVGEDEEAAIKQVIEAEIHECLGELQNRFFRGFDELQEDAAGKKEPASAAA